MANKADADENESGAAASKPVNPMKLVILGAVALFVAVLGAQVAAPLLTQMIAADGGASHAAAEGDAAHGEAQVQLAALGPAIYAPLDPPFVVSFADDQLGTRFLQLTLQAMARDDKAIAAIKQHSPALRNAFLFLISNYEVDDLATVAGKEKLRAEMLVTAKDIMTKNAGAPSIEELYFTSLVIQ